MHNAGNWKPLFANLIRSVFTPSQLSICRCLLTIITLWFYNKIKSARLSNDWFKTKQQQVRVDVHLQLAFDKQHLQQLYDDRWRNAKCEVQTSCHLGGMRILKDHLHFTAKSFKKKKKKIFLSYVIRRFKQIPQQHTCSL